MCGRQEQVPLLEQSFLFSDSESDYSLLSLQTPERGFLALDPSPHPLGSHLQEWFGLVQKKIFSVCSLSIVNGSITLTWYSWLKDAPTIAYTSSPYPCPLHSITTASFDWSAMYRGLLPFQRELRHPIFLATDGPSAAHIVFRDFSTLRSVHLGLVSAYCRQRGFSGRVRHENI